MKKINTYQKTGFIKKTFLLSVVFALTQFGNINQTKAQVNCHLTISCSFINPTCYGDCDGSITDVAGGGSGSYSYLWNNGATTNAISQLCAGTYTLTVTDLVTQCTKVRTTILKKGKVSVSFTSTNAHCGLCNGTITATGNGGNGGPFTYLWSTGATTAQIIGVCPNINYTVTVTDKKGCTFICKRKVTNVGTTVDDNNACTTDACDPVTGQTTHTPVNTDDNNACTTDGCDPITGVYHNPVNTDDQNACTNDGCDPLTGVYHNPVNTNDQNACTNDGCDPLTGVYHNPVNTDDDNVCTTDGCDPITGVYHNPVNTSDNNVCTTDGCDPITGVYHNPVNSDDQNACTDDGCDPVTGVFHTPVDCNDHNACTTDGCDPASGCTHTPITTPPTINCPSDATVSGNTGSNGPCVDLGGGGVATVTNPNPIGQPSQVGIDFRQPRNQGHPASPLNWMNGVNNITQAEYFEGMGVPQRLILTGLAAGTHTLRFRHEAVKHQASDVHGYDFLMSWNQAVATAGNIGNGSLNELLNLNAQTCNGGISATALALCSGVSTSATASIPDAMGNPPNHHGIANVNDVIACFEAIYGDRTIEIDGNASFTAFAITFDGYQGSATGDDYAWYTVSWTSASTDVMLKFAGRAAMGAGPCGYGACYGAGSIHGAPYHFKLELLDGASTGNRDNQLMVEENPTCDLTIPVTFGSPTSNGNIIIVTSDSVTTGANSVTHCRRWVATNNCNISTECTQCIQVVCTENDERLAGNVNINGKQVTASPNPFTKSLNINIISDEPLMVTVTDVAGRVITEYKNVTGSLQINSNWKAGMYFVKVKNESGDYEQVIKVVRE